MARDDSSPSQNYGLRCFGLALDLAEETTKVADGDVRDLWERSVAALSDEERVDVFLNTSMILGMLCAAEAERRGLSLSEHFDAMRLDAMEKFPMAQ